MTRQRRQALLAFLFANLALIIGRGSSCRALAEVDTMTTGSPSTLLQNLIYYPHAGQFLATPQLSVSLHDSSQTYNNLGTETNSATTQYQELTGTLTYGLMDRLRLGITESWTLVDSTSSTKLSTAGVTTSAIQGFSNPTITTTYRYAEAESRGLHADASLAFSPPIGTRMSATGGQTGSENGGPWELTLAAPFYWFFGDNEIELSPAISHYFGSTANGTTLSNSNRTSPYWTENLIFADRIHFSNEYYLQPALTLLFPYTNNSSSQAPGATLTGHDTSVELTPNLAFGYLLNSHSLLIATISYNSAVTNSYPANANNNSQSKSTETVASFLARLVF